MTPERQLFPKRSLHPTNQRSRGITVFSKQAVLSFNNDLYTILDTPGHADFSAETERVLQVLDYAILLISGSEGVQSHTETLWELLKSYHIPVFIFVNKTDISSLTKKELMEELSKKLDPKTVDFSGISGGDAEEPELCEALALCHEELMNEFLDKGKITAQEITWAVAKRRLFPCFFGSALNLEAPRIFCAVFPPTLKLRSTETILPPVFLRSPMTSRETDSLILRSPAGS